MLPAVAQKSRVEKALGESGTGWWQEVEKVRVVCGRARSRRLAAASVVVMVARKTVNGAGGDKKKAQAQVSGLHHVVRTHFHRPREVLLVLACFLVNWCAVRARIVAFGIAACAKIAAAC